MKDKKFERILRTKSELKRAVNEGEMKVFLQPQICVSKHRIYGFEAQILCLLTQITGFTVSKRLCGGNILFSAY